ncbi:MAG: class III extradiol ring-cleavage dioxygenase family protein [Candidatus Binataceae bacterium]
MGEIFAAGITHYPPLAGSDEMMAWILKRMLQNPSLPERYRQPGGWPEEMRSEWGNDDGVTAARAHRALLLQSLRKVRAQLDAFRPDLIVMWGDDQYENFREDVIPPYCIYAHESFAFAAPANNIWNEPAEKRFNVPGNVAAAKFLAGGLIDAGFDTAYSYKPLHNPLGHAFANAVLYLDYDRKGFDYPIVPFAINCYGRKVIAQRGGLPAFDGTPSQTQLDPPAPTPRRLFDLGAATARIFANSPWRVALMASSGWSHAFLTEKNHYLYPDTPADRMLFNALRASDFDTWRNYPAASVEVSGQQEILNWMCLAGALSELHREPQEMEFIDTWIFNSSKCFLIAPPR